MNKEAHLNSWRRPQWTEEKILFFWLFFHGHCHRQQCPSSETVSNYSELLPDDLRYRTVISKPLKLRGLREELGTLKRVVY
jgi:hypothetical protein